MAIPRARKSRRPGTRSRPASSAPARPAARRSPTTRMSWPSLIRASFAGTFYGMPFDVEPAPTRLQLNDPQTLYRRWEDSQWSPFEVDLSTDGQQWGDMKDEQR